MLSKMDEADDVVVNEYHHARGNPKSDMQREHEGVERLLEHAARPTLGASAQRAKRV